MAHDEKTNQAAEATHRPRRAESYGNSLIGMALAIDSRSGPTSDLLAAILTDYTNTDASLIEACWNAVAKDAGITLPYAHFKQNAEHLAPLAAARQAGGWFSDFLGTVAYAYRRDPALTPEDVGGYLSQQFDQFQMRIEATQEILRHHAEVVADDIERVVTERPELLSKRPTK